MDNNIENLVLEHLKAIRADVQDLKADNQDIKMRLSEVEHSLASVVLELGGELSIQRPTTSGH